MLALTFHGEETIKCESVPDPGILDGRDVIVEVSSTAICGSDLHIYHCREQGQDLGTTMGHEFTGTVVETGDRVQNFRRGDRVVCPFTTSCGSCFYCQAGLTCRCTQGAVFGWVEDGQGLQGAQAQYVRVPLADGSLFSLPEDVDEEEGLLLGDILATGYFAADGAGIRPGGTYVVLGCGPVGLMAIVGCRELGAERLYAVDRIPDRLALAQGFGAIPIDFSKQDPVELIREATNGRGADGVLELVGSAAASRLALDLIRPGGTISIAGVHTEPHFVFSPAEAYDKNITLRIGRCPARFYMDRLLPLVRERKYNLGAIFSHRLPLDQGAEAYGLFARREQSCTKVILKP